MAEVSNFNNSYDDDNTASYRWSKKTPKIHLILRLVITILICAVFGMNIINLFLPLNGDQFLGAGFLTSLFTSTEDGATLVATSTTAIDTALVGASTILSLISIVLAIMQVQYGTLVSVFQIGLSITVLLTNNKTSFLSGGHIFCFVVIILLSVAILAANVFNFIKWKGTRNVEKFPFISFCINTGSVILCLLCFFIPFNLITGEITYYSDNSLFGAIVSVTDLFSQPIAIAAIVFILFYIIGIVLYNLASQKFLLQPKHYPKYSYVSACYNIFFTLAFMIYTVVYRVIAGSQTPEIENAPLVSISYIPLIVVATASAVQCFFISRADKLVKALDPKTKERSKRLFSKNSKKYLFLTVGIEAGLMVCLVLSFVLKFITVETTAAIEGVEGVNVGYSGFDLMLSMNSNLSQFATVAYVFIVVGCVNLIFFIYSICSLVTRAKNSEILSKIFVALMFSSSLLITAFSTYFYITLKATPSTISSLFPGFPSLKEYVSSKIDAIKIGNQLMVPFIISVLLCLALIIIKPFTKLNLAMEKDTLVQAIENSNKNITVKGTNMMVDADGNPIPVDANGQPITSQGYGGGMGGAGGKKGKDDETEKVAIVDDNLLTFDNCPSFTELDSKIPLYDAALEERRKHVFKDISLAKLTNYIVSYAANSRLHLSYTDVDIATFLAGLASTRLSILQGMSGTGKTSLPKIFMEAICGNCEIVEVESSWRDKNELLGYFNDFSKVYSPKKFTRALYKAVLNPNVITFIVLDEMNLSRIEYYFSDFLSLMEHEEGRRQIRLLNNQIFNTYGNEHHSFKALKDNHTIVIPNNLWFIGTANRDESTFEISDKVYDRAYTMNFDHRASPITKFDDPMMPTFLEYPELRKLFEDAPSVGFNIEKYTPIIEVEKMLAPYNISFGNRIARQIETFVRVYCNCFDKPKDRIPEAVETILLSKVVHKLEYKNVTNKDFLVQSFNKLELTKCADFVSKLNEDF